MASFIRGNKTHWFFFGGFSLKPLRARDVLIWGMPGGARGGGRGASAFPDSALVARRKARRADQNEVTIPV